MEYVALLPDEICQTLPSRQQLLLFDKVLRIANPEDDQILFTGSMEDLIALEKAELLETVNLVPPPRYKAIAESRLPFEGRTLAVNGFEHGDEFFSYSPEELDSTMRMIAKEIEIQLGMQAIPILPHLSQDSPYECFRKGEVAYITLRALPVPTDSTPYAAIIDFKSDAGVRSTLLALRRWISQTAHSSLPSVEIAEEIEYLIAEYQHHLTIHKMKYQRTTLTTVVTIAAYAVENLLRLKLSKVVEAFASIRSAKIDLLEAELRLPGKEVAYIQRARNRFAPVTNGAPPA